MRASTSALLVSFLLVALAPSLAHAERTPQQFIKDQQVVLTSAIRDGDRAKVDQAFELMIDYRTIARDSLGDEWGKLKKTQQDQFVCILRSLVGDAYRRHLEKTLNYSVEFTGSSAIDKGHIVKTVATSKTDKRQDPVTIDYVVHTVDGELRVRDIRTEDSSLVDTYHSQFGRIIKKKGFDELVGRMEKKLGEKARACRPPPRAEAAD